ncbi:MAG: aldehyde dehydrogenase family protein [Cyanobacteria bacterium]|nr:aldehyde dehydrogenase family protein [Cyanobacteriota bacterium]
MNTVSSLIPSSFIHRSSTFSSAFVGKEPTLTGGAIIRQNSVDPISQTPQFAGSLPVYHSVIRGELYKTGGKKSYQVYRPDSNRPIAKIKACTPDDVDKAVLSARAAFEVWSQTNPHERAAKLRQIAGLIRTNKPELAKLDAMNNGKPLAEAEMDVDDSARHFEVFADKLLQQSDQLVKMPDGSETTIRKVPVGVVGQIIPWNYPLMMAAWKLAPALAAGCTSVIKPAEQTPLSVVRLAQLIEEAKILPPGSINVITGGKETGLALLSNPLIDKYSFTGSTQVGKIVAQMAASNPSGPKDVILELGGKSPSVVFADANLEAAVKGNAFGIFINKGEVCSANSRIYVEDAVYDQFVDRLKAYAEAIQLGAYDEPGVKMGPLVSKEQQKRVHGFVERAVQAGATLVTGGYIPTEGKLAKGNYYPPTILTNVSPDAEIAREEVFGPVVVVSRFNSEERAVAMANDSKYGLAASIWTKDADRQRRLSKAIKAGVTWVNASQPAYAEIPWGGVKQSGYGKDKLESYQTDHTVYVHNDANTPLFDWFTDPDTLKGQAE